MQYAQIRTFGMTLALGVLLLENVVAWGQAGPPTYNVDGRPIKCSQKGPLNNTLKDLDEQIGKLNAAKKRRTDKLGPAREERDKDKKQYDKTHSPGDWDKYDTANKNVEDLERQISDIDRQLALLNRRKEDAEDSHGKSCGCTQICVAKNTLEWWCPGEPPLKPDPDPLACGVGVTR